MHAMWCYFLKIVVLSCFFSQAVAFEVRALHFVMAPAPAHIPAVQYSTALKLLYAAKENGFNVLVVQLANSVDFQSMSALSRPGAWKKQQFVDYVKIARRMGIDVVPEVKLLTHQEKFFQQRYPDFLYNAVTYDPRKEGTYQVVFPFLDELISAIKPRSIHIGHDEVGGWNKAHAEKWLKAGERPLPAALFVRDVLRIHAYLTSKGVATWMWGDMLLSPHEFRSMLAVDLHGGEVGYGKQLRDQLPKDIVICDWHYFDTSFEFSSLKILQDEGFKVIGATWKKASNIQNFSRYAQSEQAYGMMATTWFHVPRNEMGLVGWIISTSGRLFRDPTASTAPSLDRYTRPAD